MIVPLIHAIFGLLHLCLSPFSLGSGQGRAAPASKAAMCQDSSSSSLLRARGESQVS